MVEALKKNPNWKKRKGPVVLVIMDGVGYGKYKEGDAVADSKMNHLDAITAKSPHTKLKAHGKAVGLPSDDDMGNSEVGHNAMGCGRVFNQGAALVSKSIETGAMFQGQAWKEIVENAKKSGGAVHFIGLFSDGNVHSHLDHLKAMIKQAKKEGVKKVRIHTLFDGRDVGETSALEYIDPFEAFLKEQSDGSFDARIASGGGRMWITMDRYGADWSMVERGWAVHVHGEGRQFKNAREAVETYRKEIPGIIDQDLKEFVVAENGPTGTPAPIGAIEDGDSVVYFNFRGDRSLEITAAFEEEKFDKFDRGRRPKVCYAGMMEYDGDAHVPKRYLVSPPSIDKTMGEYLAASGVRTLAISETQKYGHVTYFFNGNRTGKFDEKLEDFVEIKSDVVPFEQRPWMKCADIADQVMEAIPSGKYDFIRLNFPNGDMVGHTGVYQAVVCSMEAMDLQIGRIAKVVEGAGGVLVITADHGNSDDMYEHDKKTGAVSLKPDGTPKAKTSHSLNPVPCIIYDPAGGNEYPHKAGEGDLNEGLGISSIAATCIQLLGFIPPVDYDRSVLKM
ncbi:2,3-bisphosphoglycerate-independent phosphoglycerate mutase [Leadbettera azotonutricia]|uniref:2,3-bisphosphoglycerate-independent phosphoglycerate mutase n=1 Tax=Leadbettera azotonutricia (strain ATCC BAA-888 / DSM 13862 / ZAS-9) TaxID=545695 RepID=F5Y859_LEAAZ|nr:2,3-bisphosphoglycerate-independent phosphoglycerate mutase [Leadbettera azotonutricia]AEF80188.1 2,3-bisphosphoglycerate-independent phosphoglycerate mutase [Leadbettera azotonutricia ZAS-9]